jgi:AraC family transcriptional regulator
VNAGTTELERVAERKEQHLEVVRQVVKVMRERLAEPLTLCELARIVHLSRFHFNRIFRLTTGVPPGRFLAALRMSMAKRLLLESNMNVTDICMSVGYSSLGTFTTLFTQQVGVGPREFRRLGAAYGNRAVAEMLQIQPPASGNAHSSITGAHSSITGQVFISEPDMVIIMGLFYRSMALGKPVACVNKHGPGSFQITGIPDGTYCLLATASPADATIGEALVGGCRPGQWAGLTDNPVTVEGGHVTRPARITLRPMADTHPPILAGIPLLSIMLLMQTYSMRS